MEIFDFRKNGQFWFENDEIENDPILKRIAKRLKVKDGGGLEVEAANSNSAFRKFFGVTPANAVDLDENICPPMTNYGSGWSSEGFYGDDVYEIYSESSW